MVYRSCHSVKVLNATFVICLLVTTVQDLSKLNRDPSRVIYVSGHALESCLQPENSVAIKPWKKETDDTTLIDLIPFLECKYLSASHVMLPFI